MMFRGIKRVLKRIGEEESYQIDKFVYDHDNVTVLLYRKGNLIGKFNEIENIEFREFDNISIVSAKSGAVKTVFKFDIPLNADREEVRKMVVYPVIE